MLPLSYVTLGTGKLVDLTDYWKKQQFEKASKSAVIERKIRVNWLPADSGASPQQNHSTEGVS